MICFVRRSTIDYDIRLRKYVDACVDTGTKYIAITWDRLKNSNSYENEYQYKMKAPYGGGVKSIFQFVGWVIFLYWQLFAKFRRYKVIHACNLETLVFVIPLRLFGKRIIFDIYDTVNPGIERKLLRFVDVMILPNIRRLKQEGVTKEELGEKLLIVENVPNFKNERRTDAILTGFPNTLKLAYVGVLEKDIRGIEDTLDAVMKNKQLCLDIAGVGSGLEPRINECASKCNRIKYHGKVKYEEALEIMSESDFIVAIYKPSFTPYVYASPNKFYESLYLGKPIISSKGTIVGDQIKQHNTGYLLEEGEDSLDSLFYNLDNSFVEEYKTKANNCRNLWDSKYRTYYDDVHKGEYIKICTKLAQHD